MQRLTTSIGSLPTAVLRRSAVGECTTWIVVVPGNPGLVDFYTEFVEHLWQEHQGRYTVYALGHAGHGVDPAGAPICSLDDQVRGLGFSKQHGLCRPHNLP